MLETPKVLHTTRIPSERFNKGKNIWTISSQIGLVIVLSEEILKKIKRGEITSRRQIYKIRGRSKKLIQWLNDNEILVPTKTKWSKERIIKEIQRQENPKAANDYNLAKQAWKHFGSWNNALYTATGKINQYRYTELSDEEMLKKITFFIKKFRRLPLREEFDGSSLDRPYWEAFIIRFNISKWSDVFGLIDLTGIEYYFDKKHGFGTVILFDEKVFLSRQEYLIAKYLVENSIDYEKEVPYGNSNYIFDFYLPKYNTYIEYYGIETSDYKKRIDEKRNFYNGRKVIEIFKHDNTIKKLDLEVQRL